MKYSILYTRAKHKLDLPEFHAVTPKCSNSQDNFDALVIRRILTVFRLALASSLPTESYYLIIGELIEIQCCDFKFSEQYKLPITSFSSDPLGYTTLDMRLF